MIYILCNLREICFNLNYISILSIDYYDLEVAVLSAYIDSYLQSL
jgi:hypothetical protein